MYKQRCDLYMVFTRLFPQMFIVTLTFDPDLENQEGSSYYHEYLNKVWWGYTKQCGLNVVHKVIFMYVNWDLDISPLTLKINRDHPFIMDNTCATSGHIPRNIMCGDSKSKAWQMDRQTTDEVIPMWYFASLEPQKLTTSGRDQSGANVTIR